MADTYYTLGPDFNSTLDPQLVSILERLGESIVVLEDTTPCPPGRWMTYHHHWTDPNRPPIGLVFRTATHDYSGLPEGYPTGLGGNTALVIQLNPPRDGSNYAYAAQLAFSFGSYRLAMRTAISHDTFDAATEWGPWKYITFTETS